MGFLGTEAGLISDATLIAEMAGFLILVLGVIYLRRKNFLKHDKMAKIAVLLGSLSFIWMGFSLASNFLALISANLMGLLIVAHIVTGAIGLFMGIFLVLDEIKKTKTSMSLTFSFWTVAMFLGFLLYGFVYV